jgi:WD40 repeat protein
MRNLTLTLLASIALKTHATEIKILWEQQPSLSPISAIAFSSDSTLLAAAATDGTIRVYETSLGLERWAFTNSVSVLNMAFAGNDILRCWSSNSLLSEIRISTSKELYKEQLPMFEQTSFASSGDLFVGLTPENFGTVEPRSLWVYRTGQFQIVRREDAVNQTIALHPLGNLLAIVTYSAEAPLLLDMVDPLTWELKDHAQSTGFDWPILNPVLQPIFSRSGDLLGIQNYGTGPEIYNLRTKTLTDGLIDDEHFFQIPCSGKAETYKTLAVDFALDEHVMIFLEEENSTGERSLQFWVPHVFCTIGQRVLKWSPDRQQKLEKFALAPDGRSIVTGTQDGRLYMLQYPFLFPQLAIAYPFGTRINLFFVGGTGPFQLQQKPSLTGDWYNLGTPTNEREASITFTRNSAQFFQVLSAPPP